MANPKSPEAAPAPDHETRKVVQIGRATIALNVIVQFFIFVVLIGMVNYLGFRHYKRWDFSRDKKYALSSQTRALLTSLPKPVNAVIFFSGGAEIYGDVQALLREYEYASKSRFNVEVVDPYRNITRAQELQTKYKFGASENILILDYEGKSKFVNATDMAEVEEPDQMAQMMGQGPKIKAFKGEQSITTALLELVENKPNKVYYLTGHNESDLAGEDLKVFNEAMKRQNIAVAALTILNENAIPADTRAVILNAPKYDLSELELKLLGEFFENKGRVFVMLNPTVKTPRLNEWLAIRGIKPSGDRVIRTGNSLVQGEDGALTLKNGVISSPAFSVLDSKSKLTKDIANATSQLLGLTQSLQLDRVKETTDKLRITALLQAAEGYWGEMEFSADTQTPAFDPNNDHIGPLTLAAATEKGGVGDSRVKVETSRLVVIGNGELLSSKAYRLSEGLSIDFLTNTLNWLLDREELIGIPAKEKRQTTISLKENEMNRLKGFVLVIVPGLALLGGVANWLLRRN